MKVDLTNFSEKVAELKEVSDIEEDGYGNIALLFIKNTLADVFSEAFPKTSSFLSLPFPFSSDLLNFGQLWKVIRDYAIEGNLFSLVQKKREEINKQKEHWRPFVEEKKKGTDFQFYQDIEKSLKEGKISRLAEGAGSAYVLYDGNGRPRFVIKPVDEDIFCLNNPKKKGGVLDGKDFRARDDIPLYRSAQTDTLASFVATAMGIPWITPKTAMGIISSEAFYDLSDHLDVMAREEFLELAGFPDKEKLCSVQEFVPTSLPLFEVVNDLYSRVLGETFCDPSDEQIERLFDQEDFETINIFIWTLYDNDGHSANIRTYEKSVSPEGENKYGLVKIDNGLSFPEKNSKLSNMLCLLPNAKKELSKSSKELIAKIPVKAIVDQMYLLEMDEAVAPFKERIEVLQHLSQRDNMTMEEINMRMLVLEKPHGKQHALSSMTFSELEKIFYDEPPKESGKKREIPSSKEGYGHVPF